MRDIKIASRPSRLAAAQAEIIRGLLNNFYDGHISVLEISTKGDRDKSDFPYNSESAGFFTCEVEKAIIDGKADIAVHSLKDLPTTSAPQLFVAAIPKREFPADVLVASGEVSSISDLPAGASIGTSSLRRIAQIKHYRGDLKCVRLRGNVESRIAKVDDGQVEAVILAYAGLSRLGLTDRISAILSTEDFLPAPAQGALAVQIRRDDKELGELLCRLDDKPTRIAVEAERRVLALTQGGCSVPLGVYANIRDDIITIDAMLSDIEGKRYLRCSETGHISQAGAAAEKIAGELLTAGGEEILDKIRADEHLDGHKG